jgi:hypothetical protein
LHIESYTATTLFITFYSHFVCLFLCMCVGPLDCVATEVLRLVCLVVSFWLNRHFSKSLEPTTTFPIFANGLCMNGHTFRTQRANTYSFIYLLLAQSLKKVRSESSGPSLCFVSFFFCNCREPWPWSKSYGHTWLLGSQEHLPALSKALWTAHSLTFPARFFFFLVWPLIFPTWIVFF